MIYQLALFDQSLSLTPDHEVVFLLPYCTSLVARICYPELVRCNIEQCVDNIRTLFQSLPNPLDSFLLFCYFNNVPCVYMLINIPVTLGLLLTVCMSSLSQHQMSLVSAIVAQCRPALSKLHYCQKTTASYVATWWNCMHTIIIFLSSAMIATVVHCSYKHA